MTIRTQDGWELADGGRFVGPAEWLERVADVRGSLVLDVVASAFAAAADGLGQIIDYRPDDFYRRHVSAAMRNEDDPKGWALTYDRFSAAALMDAAYGLVADGFLAHRGNGASVDYRLALPLEGDHR